MRISYDWLKDYIDINTSPEKLAENLTMAGLSVESLEKKKDDAVLEIEITSNRPDWLSYIGVAREVAALTGKKLKIPSVPSQGHQVTKSQDKVKIKIEDAKLCGRYTARIIRNVKVGESPEWLKRRIEAMGLRSINNIVDITNFCLFETGEPLHAFDLDKLSGSPAIIVRKAAKGEKIIAIDGVERQLDDSMLIIADAEKPVAIAGVMGGIATEVNLSTKNILLEAAYFDPISIRRTSRKLALPTESSYRFERKVDIENIAYSSDRAALLISEIAGGRIEEFIDIGKSGPAKRTISLKLEKIKKILGVDIPAATIKKILSSLGLKLKLTSKNTVELGVPVFRYDLQNETDIIEEVARIYGYSNIPETIPPVVEKGGRYSMDALVTDKIRRALAGMGLNEIITYSLLSKKELNTFGVSDKDVIEIKNPLSAEQEIMQPTLIAGMLKSVRWNINRKIKDLMFFELGKIYYRKKENDFNEQGSLSIGICGQIVDGWKRQPRPSSFYDLKGVIETLLNELGVKNYLFKEERSAVFSPAASARIEADGELLGIIGQMDPGLLGNYDIKDPVFAAEIDVDKLIGKASLKKYFKESPRYPSVIRDISIISDKSIQNEKIMSTIKSAAGTILKDAQLVDRYTGEKIPAGKISLTYRLEYQGQNKTLEDKDIQDTHTRVIKALESNLGARLR